MLLDATITNLKDWSGIFKEKALFQPLAEEIFRQLGQPCPGLETCTSGSNAVFRAALAQQLVHGLLLHDYGAWIIRDRIAVPESVGGLRELKRRLLCCLNR